MVMTKQVYVWTMVLLRSVYDPTICEVFSATYYHQHVLVLNNIRTILMQPQCTNLMPKLRTVTVVAPTHFAITAASDRLMALFTKKRARSDPPPGTSGTVNFDYEED